MLSDPGRPIPLCSPLATGCFWFSILELAFPVCAGFVVLCSSRVGEDSSSYLSSCLLFCGERLTHIVYYLNGKPFWQALEPLWTTVDPFVLFVDQVHPYLEKSVSLVYSIIMSCSTVLHCLVACQLPAVFSNCVQHIMIEWKNIYITEMRE